MAFRAMLAFQEGYTSPVVQRRQRLTKYVPPQNPAVPSRYCPTGHDLPHQHLRPRLALVIYATADGPTEVVYSARGIQQGCKVGLLGYSAALMPLMNKFKASPPVPDVHMSAFVDGIAVLLPPALAHDLSAVVAITERLESELEPAGVILNRHTFKVRVAEGRHADVLTASQRKEINQK